MILSGPPEAQRFRARAGIFGPPEMVGRASMGPILDSCCIGTTQKLLLIISPASGLWQMPSLQDTVEASCTGGSREYQLREPQLNRREDLVDQGNACFPRRVFLLAVSNLHLPTVFLLGIL